MGASKRAAMEAEEQSYLMPSKKPTISKLTAPTKPHEIEWRIGHHKQVLPYIDARYVYQRLTEVFGLFGWQTHYERFGSGVKCVLSIWDNEKKVWVAREDAADESNIEPTKGGVSNAIKRAAVTIGIGQDLYDYPKIFLPKNYDFKYLSDGMAAQLRDIAEAVYSGKEKRSKIWLAESKQMTETLSASIDFEEGMNQIKNAVEMITNKDVLNDYYRQIDPVYKTEDRIIELFKERKEKIG